MNFHQIASAAAKGRTRAATDCPARSIRKAKTGKLRTPRAKKQAAFLWAFGKSRSITLSARLAGIDRTTHYEWLAKDAKYKAAFDRKALMAADAIQDKLVRVDRYGVFKPLIYKGRFCYASRIRIICQLADGTSAFQDELPKGAKVTGSRIVTVHDGEMIGRTRHDARALVKLAALWMPERWGHVGRRGRKPRAR